MTGAEVREAIQAMKQTPAEIAFEFDVSERSVRRWMAEGAPGDASAALRYAQRLHACGIAWRKNEVTVRIGPAGVVIAREADIARQIVGFTG